MHSLSRSKLDECSIIEAWTQRVHANTLKTLVAGGRLSSHAPHIGKSTFYMSEPAASEHEDPASEHEDHVSQHEEPVSEREEPAEHDEPAEHEDPASEHDEPPPVSEPPLAEDSIAPMATMVEASLVNEEEAPHLVVSASIATPEKIQAAAISQLSSSNHAVQLLALEQLIVNLDRERAEGE